MRTPDEDQSSMLSHVGPQDRVLQDHPLRAVLAITNEVLRSMNRRSNTLYAPNGRASIPPERLLRALLLQVLYSVRSERQLTEQPNYNILFRWSVSLNMDDPIWHFTTFSKNRDWLLEGDVTRDFFERIRGVAESHGLISKKHFAVDGTLLETWASHKSVRLKDEEPPTNSGSRNPNGDFRDTQRKNDTHASATDPDARLFYKSSATPGNSAPRKRATVRSGRINTIIRPPTTGLVSLSM